MNNMFIEISPPDDEDGSFTVTEWGIAGTIEQDGVSQDLHVRTHSTYYPEGGGSRGEVQGIRSIRERGLFVEDDDRTHRYLDEVTSFEFSDGHTEMVASTPGAGFEGYRLRFPDSTASPLSIEEAKATGIPLPADRLRMLGFDV